MSELEQILVGLRGLGTVRVTSFSSMVRAEVDWKVTVEIKNEQKSATLEVSGKGDTPLAAARSCRESLLGIKKMLPVE